MIIINSLDEMSPYYNKETNTYVFNDNVEFKVDVDICSNICAYDINAKNIRGRNIFAHTIDAEDIKAQDLDVGDITANNIIAQDIYSGDIQAHDIKANDLNAGDITACDIGAEEIRAYSIKADNISYGVFYVVYGFLKCNSIHGKRETSLSHECAASEIKISEDGKNEN